MEPGAATEVEVGLDTFTLVRKVGKDGILKVELPVGVSDAEVEVVIVVNRVQRAPSVRVNGQLAVGELEIIRQKHPRAYEPWSRGEEERLLRLYSVDQSVKQISRILERQPGAIRSRLRKLNALKQK